MSKEVVNKKTGEVATYQEGAWGSEDINNNDIIIPKILCMQGLSEMVTEGNARMGEFRSSLDGTILGDEKKPVEFITFQNNKTWQIFHNGKYHQTIPVTPENEHWPIEEISGDVVIKRNKSLNFFCLRPEDIAKDEAFPYMVSFKMTSYQAGKKLATFLAQLRMFHKPSAAQVFAVSASRETNDKGTFMVLDVNKVRAATDKEIGVAWTWHQAIKDASRVKVDDSDLEDKSATSKKETPVGKNAGSQKVGTAQVNV